MSRTSTDSGQVPSKQRVCNKLIVLAVFGALVAGGLLYAAYSTSSSKWHCSPSEPRPSGTKAWEEVTGPAQPVGEPNEAFFASVKVSSDQENFFVEHPSGKLPENPFDYEVDRMTPGEPVKIGEGTLELLAVGTAYLSASQTMEDEALYRFYDAHLRGMSREQIEEFEVYQFTEPGTRFRYSPFPRVKLGFRHEAIEDLMFQGIRVFDASTKKELTGGYSSSGRKTHHWFTTHTPLWHRGPVDIVIEVSYGPSKTFEFEPRAGKGFSEGNFECRLVCALEGADIHSSGTSSRDNTMIHEFHKAPPDKAGLRFVFACQPAASKMPVTFEFLDADGKVLSGSGSSTSGRIHDRDLKEPPDKVARIRARYRTRRLRILIHLPCIPGLPEEDKAVDDLFDVRIPYVRLHDAGQAGQFLTRTLQLQGSSRTGPVPANSIDSIRFPLEFSDATVREIAQLYAQGGSLKVDLENERLRIEYPVPLSTKLKRFLQRLTRGSRRGL